MYSLNPQRQCSGIWFQIVPNCNKRWPWGTSHLLREVSFNRIGQASLLGDYITFQYIGELKSPFDTGKNLYYLSVSS